MKLYIKRLYHSLIKMLVIICVLLIILYLFAFSTFIKVNNSSVSYFSRDTTLTLQNSINNCNYIYSPSTCTPDYYRFSLLKNNNTFLIHGLWVEECAECPTCGYPSFCNQNNPNNQSHVICNFDYRKVQPLWSSLQNLWYPGNQSAKNNKLLAHEWCKHGVCTNLTELQYFNTSLSLYKILVNDGLLDLCDYGKEECYFVVDKDFYIKNHTTF